MAAKSERIDGLRRGGTRQRPDIPRPAATSTTGKEPIAAMSQPTRGPAPLKTYYGGCWFRSRLEARWAVFLTRLGLEWEWENARYKVATPAGSYLPDFYLPLLDLYLEIKPAHPDIVDPDGFLRWRHFAGQVTTEWDHGRTAMLTGSIPNPDQVDRYGPPRQQEWSHQPVIMLEHWHAAWCACPSGRHYDLQPQASGGRILCGCPRVQDDRLYRTGDDPKIVNAYAAARSARFERGREAG